MTQQFSVEQRKCVLHECEAVQGENDRFFSHKMLNARFRLGITKAFSYHVK